MPTGAGNIAGATGKASPHFYGLAIALGERHDMAILYLAMSDGVIVVARDGLLFASPPPCAGPGLGRARPGGGSWPGSWCSQVAGSQAGVRCWSHRAPAACYLLAEGTAETRLRRAVECYRTIWTWPCLQRGDRLDGGAASRRDSRLPAFLFRLCSAGAPERRQNDAKRRKAKSQRKWGAREKCKVTEGRRLSPAYRPARPFHLADQRDAGCVERPYRGLARWRIPCMPQSP